MVTRSTLHAALHQDEWLTSRPAAAASMSTEGEKPSRPCEPDVEQPEMQAAVHQGEYQLVDRAERICAVCLESPAITIALPCRHSVLCEACMVQVRQQGGRCPICRAHIDACYVGHFATEFVDLAPDVLATIGQPLVRVHAFVYEGMYNHVRVFLLVGVVAGVGSAACFLAPVPMAALGFALAGVSVCVGYLPWLAVSISAFESAGGTGSGTGGQRPQFISHADLGRPLLLTAKGIVLLVSLPLALVVFFLPYALYAGVLRPFASHVVPFLLRMVLRIFLDLACYSYMYVLRPIGTGIWYLGRATAWLAGKVGTGMSYAGKAAAWLAIKVVEGMQLACKAIASGAKAAWRGCLVPIGKAIGSCSRATYKSVLAPLGRGLAAGAACLWRRACELCKALWWASTEVGSLVFRWALVPTWRGVCWCASRLGHVCSVAAQGLGQYVLVPCGRGIAKGAELAFLHVLVPVGGAVGHCLRCACNGVATLTGLLSRGLAEASGAAFAYVLAPVGRGLAAAASAVARGIAAVARATYSYVFAPVGGAVGLCAEAFVRVLWAAATASSGALTAAASAVYARALLPAAHALAAAAAAAAGVLSAATTTAYKYAILPAAQAALACGAAAGDALRTAAVHLREAGAWFAGLAWQAAQAVREAVAASQSISQAPRARTDFRCYSAARILELLHRRGGQAARSCVPPRVAGVLIAIAHEVSGAWLAGLARQAAQAVREAVVSISELFRGTTGVIEFGCDPVALTFQLHHTGGAARPPTAVACLQEFQVAISQLMAVETPLQVYLLSRPQEYGAVQRVWMLVQT
eukprot:CAMPEP_0179209818 /NCGR_PEP_ID=MMETSP0796-20121207/104644_1 /TAXON_ID=73915 /ORGANISM="Pyrodinium bahamense, Strain pbaha01" /LENGTH=808 /DNA_ID=CAMNT_0020914777 /DNA_START=87 /DNA_END=2516 /DNA_ORIENTATION=-